MATSLAAQLSKISANSTNSLNLKAQKAAHSKSLIFEPRVAASQSFDTIYILCHEGFQELCLLDGRFLEFQRDIFGEQSQTEDRVQMTAAENSELNKRLEAFLGLVGGRLRLTPAIKAVEWLLRRFRVHEYNTSFLLTTFLPYHTLPLFTTLLSILPNKLPQEYEFLNPYVRSLMPPPRRTIVQTATNSNSFASALNTYVLRICKSRQHYPALLAFWAGIMTEAMGGMLDKSRSGRKGVQEQKEHDVILRLLPTLNEGLAMKSVPDLRIGCYMLLSVMASKGGLDDKVLTAMMEAVVLGWTTETIIPGLVCLSVLAQHRGAKQMTKRLTKELLKVENLPSLLLQLSNQRRLDKLANGLCLSLVDRLRNHGDLRGLPIVEKMIENGILSDQQSSVIVKSLLLVAHQVDESSDQINLRQHLASSLVTLTQLPGHGGDVVRGTLKDTEIDMDELEMKLHTTIRPAILPAPADSPMEDASTEVSAKGPSFQTLFEQLPKKTVSESSFLSHDASHVYPDLCRAFLASTSNPTDLDSFDAAPILTRDSALENALYFTFYIRTWCGPYPVLARSSALQMVSRRLSDPNISKIDIQALVPYAIAALADPAAKVRRAGAELLVTISHLYPENVESKKELKTLSRWEPEGLYGKRHEGEELKWLSPDVAIRMLRELLIPALEECVLDAKHIESVFQRSLQSPGRSESPKQSDLSRLPQSSRASILSFLASHVVHTPLFSVKLRLISSLNQVRGVAGLTRTSVLLPVLQEWSSLSPAEASKHCKDEEIDSAEFDDQCFMIIIPSDEEGLQFLTSVVVRDVAADRPTLLTAAFKRLRAMWSSLKGELKLRMAQMLMDSALSSSDKMSEHHDLAVQTSSELLSSLPLSTDILLAFIEQLPTAAKLADQPPASKRRRTSHGEVARNSIQDSKELAAAIRKVTLVLQLIDSSNPKMHPELLKGLFNVLAELQHLKTQVKSELAYLQGLVLSSLLAIFQGFKSDRNIKFDRAAVRADLLVDCVQKTSSPQVQNAALLLIAALADIAPELVLHSVMPIFTFMGHSVLRQNDDYSAHVIGQTIREVIPPLISSLRKGKANIVTGAAELLLSFVAAYEHVPNHRRKGLFTSLTQTLGPEDFLFALLAMLVDKYGSNEGIKTFSVELSSSFSVETQLLSVAKYLDMVKDILKPKPTYSSILLNANDDGVPDPHKLALTELELLPSILSQKRLINQTGKILERDDMDAARVRDLYSGLLENLLGLADLVKSQKRLHSSCGDILESLLGLLSTSEFVKSVEGLLDRPNESLRRKILRSLEVRIDHESPSDAASRAAMLGFLPQLTAIIRESTDLPYKHIAVACVDKISEKYGKKDLEAVSAAAETIASSHCLGQSDESLRVMALLCLASLVDILREGIVSVLPSAIPKALEYMEESLKVDSEAPKLHNAGYAFISALVHHLPYMISGGYLDRLLQISNASAVADLDDEADESRQQCLRLAAKQVDAKSMFGALEKDWELAAAKGPLSLHEYMDVLTIAIDKHPKVVVTKYSAILAKIFQKAFDLRRQKTGSDDAFTSDTVAELEAKLNDAAIKMIYKFNDATFRPIFENLVEWASSSLPKKDKAGRTLRLQSIYGFMAMFFDNLKSIVTSYASYLLDNAVDVLKTVDPKDDESKTLWSAVLRTLTKCFEHDQDEFWQSPAHFSAIAPVLCAQFTHAPSLPLAAELIPAVVELAAAADSSDHHKELNGTIMKHLRSEIASVRLAAVKCEQALTDRLGEEWLSMLPEMLPFISELQEDDDDVVEKETHRWIMKIEGVLGESLDSMLQ
ncbi:ARM repeat-containing protein [Venustampulla echinocandica]|uniref:U3 small nucleolar RNA-associated protein 10 n=1 Tax=Venustampulla echinocandica TaxID=2656787 RepID=A0A370TY55_9HELO|nr:ARM repeat-containing protein [Venustampulla echinocandica]RDL40455.1 ARM repeat-containing protein [Venustampulla echinocandica]